MKIREHLFALGRCQFCGARQEITEVDELGCPMPDTRSCIEREDYQTRPRPEPKLRQIACEDAEAIMAAMLAIREAAKPRCAQSGQTVHDCLRTSARCPETCHHREFWTGPQIAPEEAGAYC